jgi:hypothetical protein
LASLSRLILNGLETAIVHANGLGKHPLETIAAQTRTAKGHASIKQRAGPAAPPTDTAAAVTQSI